MVEGVLGVPATAGHALTAFATPGTGRPGTPEVRVLDLGTGFLPAVATEEDAHVRRFEGVPDAHFFGNRSIHLVGVGHRRVRHHSEHAFGLIVVRRQFVAPVGDVPPLRVGVERLQRAVERVRIDH